MYSIRPYQAYSFRCWFSNNSVLAFVVTVLCQDLVSFYSSVPEALWCCSPQPIFSDCQDHVLIVLILLTGVSCPLFKFSPFYQVLPPFLTEVLSEIFLTHCAFLSIVPEAVCCCSLFLPIKFFFLWVAGFHLVIWDVLHKTISSLSFRCWFSNNSARPVS